MKSGLSNLMMYSLTSGLHMVRSFAVAAVLSSLAAPAWTQNQPAPETAVAEKATPAIKPAAKKSSPKAKAAAKPTASADSGPCDLGVIAAAGSPTGLNKIGLTVFGNEYSEAPSDIWGIDDLVFARVRAAAGPGIAVRRIAYAKDAFEPYNNPEKKLFGDARENLTTIIRRIAGNSGCARYLVVTRFAGVLPGTNQSLTGVGFYTQGPFGKAAAFAFIRVAVFDGQTFAIRDPFGSFGARLSAVMSAMGHQEFIRAADTEFPASPEAAAKDTKLRDVARALVAERLDRMLPEYLKP